MLDLGSERMKHWLADLGKCSTFPDLDMSESCPDVDLGSRATPKDRNNIKNSLATIQDFQLIGSWESSDWLLGDMLKSLQDTEISLSTPDVVLDSSDIQHSIEPLNMLLLQSPSDKKERQPISSYNKDIGSRKIDIGTSAQNCLQLNKGSVGSAPKSLRSQRQGGEILALYHYTMDEVIIHAQLAQKHNADPQEVVKRFLVMWKRFSLLRDEWETYDNFAVFCSRHNLVSWVEAVLKLDINSEDVFHFFSSICATRNAALVELMVKHQLRHSLPSTTLFERQRIESGSTSKLLFDIVDSKRVDLMEHWCVQCEALRRRGVVSHEQILETISKSDDRDGDSAFFKVCRNYRFPMIDAILDIGVDFGKILGTRSPNDQGKPTALHWLSTYPGLDGPENHAKFTTVLSRLASHRAYVNSIDYYGNTPLHNLCRAKNLSYGAIFSLLDHGADPNICDERGRTPLHVLCDGYNRQK